MANHCENVLRVYGNHDDLVRFDCKFRAWKEDIDENYHFDNLYPTPSLPICETVEWRKSHWSVKVIFMRKHLTGIPYGIMTWKHIITSILLVFLRRH